MYGYYTHVVNAALQLKSEKSRYTLLQTNYNDTVNELSELTEQYDTEKSKWVAVIFLGIYMIIYVYIVVL